MLVIGFLGQKLYVRTKWGVFFMGTCPTPIRTSWPGVQPRVLCEVPQVVHITHLPDLVSLWFLPVLTL